MMKLAAWRQIWQRVGQQHRQAGRRAGPLLLALVVTLGLALGGRALTTYGQESPLPTPVPAEAPPAEAPPAEAPPPVEPVTLPSLSGVVMNADGEPLPGMVVVAYRRQQANWSAARQTTTNDAGEYRFPWMPSGTYRLYFRDPQGNYAATYYPDAADIEAAEDVVVMGVPVERVDATISAGGQISGTVTWPDGPAPFDTVVRLYYVTAAPIETRLNLNDDLTRAPELRRYRLVASKSFTESVVEFGFPGLAAGTYRVCAEANALHTTAHECFDNAALGIHGTDVVVATGATVADVAIAFGDGADLATLTGMVAVLPATPADATSAVLTPAAGVDVEIVPDPKVDFFVAPQPQRTTTNDAGIFRFDELPFGQYVVRFSDADGLYLASDYRAMTDVGTTDPGTNDAVTNDAVTVTAPVQTGPTVISLSRNEEVSITAMVSAAGLITGSVIIDGAIAGMGGQVAAYTLREDTWQVGGTGNIVAATGAYTVTGLRGGTYRLQFTVDIPNAIFYGDVGATLDNAADIVVMTGTTVGGIVMDLTPYLAGVAYGSISGQVIQDGAPQANMLVRVYDAVGDCCVAPPPVVTTLTDAEGRYTVGGLSPGRYKLGVGPADQPYPTLFAPDQRAYELATVYSVGNPADGVSRQNYGEINLTLAPTGSVARRVLRPDDTPVVGAVVNIYQRLGDPGNWPLVATTLTNDEGRYSFAGLVPDIYQVCIVAAGIAEPTCNGRGGQGLGLDVVVTAGQEATGLDIVSVP